MHLTQIYSHIVCISGVYFQSLILQTFGPFITAASQSNTEPNSTHQSAGPPTIIITAPSREDIYASKTNMTLADAVKERRPAFTPIVVGKKLVSKK